MGVEVSGLDQLRALATAPDRLVKRLDVLLQDDIADTALRTARARARSRVQGKAAATLRVETIAHGAVLSNHGGSALGRLLFAGAEFGGQRKRTTYARRSSRGRAHTVRRRRTTMMFPAHLGSAGYMVWPAIRSATKGVSKRVEAIIEAEVPGG